MCCYLPIHVQTWTPPPLPPEKLHTHDMKKATAFNKGIVQHLKENSILRTLPINHQTDS